MSHLRQSPTTRQESVLLFLDLRKSQNADLVARCGPGMDIQVNPFGEHPHPDKPNTFIDDEGINEWGPIRIDSAKRAGRPMLWPLEEHADAIGCTGWDWSAKVSRWVGFDFDDISGHAPGRGITDEELEQVKKTAMALPWVQVRRSTGGQGIHLYVFFAGGIPTEDRIQHAALARAVLRMMSEATGFDFSSQVDACGANMWIWARRATADNQGLALIKDCESPFPVDQLPPNWIALHVTKSGAIRVKVDGIHTHIALDAKHKAKIEQLRKSGFSTIWDAELGLLQTHTCGLAETEHFGDFTTISRGIHPATPNCFAFPGRDGSWRVFRFSPGAREHESWTHSEWTYTTYNGPIDFAEAIGRFPLVRTAKGSQASFEQVAEIARLSGCRFAVPEVAPREVTMTPKKDGILLRMPVSEGETLAGWGRHKTTRADEWEVIIDRGQPIKATRIETPAQEQIYHTDQLRHAFLNGKAWGWYRRIRDSWRSIPRADARATILALHGDRENPERLLADYQARSLDIVTNNFGPEYPSEHEWNLYGARFRYAMADEDGPTKHFNMVLAHLGEYLDPYVQADEWCQSHGIKTGAQYLLVWIAIMVQQPSRHLPWLFLVGLQDHGKSAFADMLFVIFRVGARNVDKAFTRDSNFDEEFAGTILAVISETSLTFPTQRARKNYNKIKQVTVADENEIEKKGHDSQRLPNQTHFVQESNYITDCPIVDSDDTRVVVVEAPPLLPDTMKGDDEMTEGWRSEAPHFIRQIMTLDLAPFKGGCGKLALPCLFTGGKQRVISEVARILSEDSADQKFVALACDMQDQLTQLACAGKLNGVEASEVLSMLKLGSKHEWAQHPEVIGTMLKHVDPNVLLVVPKRRRYWITPAMKVAA